ncbi:hypothetical protein ACHAW6_004418 [Cyclotella cf. meneghiniana]
MSSSHSKVNPSSLEFATNTDAIKFLYSSRRGTNVTPLKDKKVKDVYIQVYDSREIFFSDQTGSYPTRSQRANK